MECTTVVVALHVKSFSSPSERERLKKQEAGDRIALFNSFAFVCGAPTVDAEENEAPVQEASNAPPNAWTAVQKSSFGVPGVCWRMSAGV